MKTFSKKWVKSTAPGKQRKYRANAPLHLRRKMMAGHLSKELIEKHGKRAFPIRAGDKVKIMRGDFKGIIGKVDRVDVKKMKIYIVGAEREKGEGQPASKYPVDPSSVKIIDMDLTDARRKKSLEKK